MPEGEIRSTEDLKRDAGYVVAETIFNATVLHPLPHLPKISPYMKDVGNIHLEVDDELTFSGTAGELKLFGDVVSETPLFKPAQGIRDRYSSIADSDVLAINHLAVERLKRKATK